VPQIGQSLIIMPRTPSRGNAGIAGQCTVGYPHTRRGRRIHPPRDLSEAKGAPRSITTKPPAPKKNHA
jgi:hypothetical protein